MSSSPAAECLVHVCETETGEFNFGHVMTVPDSEQHSSAERIDRVCNSFAKKLRSGERPRIKRFLEECSAAAAQLDHPGIVPVYEVGAPDGQHYFSMGFVEGESLAEKLNDGPLPQNAAAELVRKIADAMQYAHEKGIVHRDLKPENILLSAEPGSCDPGPDSPLSGPVSSVRLSLDGSRLAILVAGEQAVRLWHFDRLNSQWTRLGSGW